MNEQYNNLLALPLPELIARADAVRRQYMGDTIELCSIFNAKSGKCSEDCRFCAQSAHNHADVSTYALKDPAAMVQAAREARKNGAVRFGIVTSGNRLADEELDAIIAAVRQIRQEVGMDVCASLGALSWGHLQCLFDAGCTRYHHNIETSPRFYNKIVTTHSFDERVTTVRAAKDIGFDVCSGGIIGMGETWDDRIAMALLLKDLAVDSVPLNILVPIPGTPLEHITPIPAHDVIRTIAIFRIILQDKLIKIAAGRESALKDFQALGFMAGACGMLIGGYLTVRGRSVDEDQRLVEEIKRLWKSKIF